MDMITDAAVVGRHRSPRLGGKAAGTPAAEGGEFLTFRLGGEEYGIDILRVQEIRSYEQPTRIANAPISSRAWSTCGRHRSHRRPAAEAGLRHGRVQRLHGGDRAERRAAWSARWWTRCPTCWNSRASRSARAGLNSNVDGNFITGIGSVADRMLILMDIEGLMSSADMGLINNWRRPDDAVPTAGDFHRNETRPHKATRLWAGRHRRTVHGAAVRHRGLVPAA